MEQLTNKEHSILMEGVTEERVNEVTQLYAQRLKLDHETAHRYIQGYLLAVAIPTPAFHRLCDFFNAVHTPEALADIFYMVSTLRKGA